MPDESPARINVLSGTAVIESDLFIFGSLPTPGYTGGVMTLAPNTTAQFDGEATFKDPRRS